MEGVSPDGVKERLKLRFAEAVSAKTFLEDSKQMASQISGMKAALLGVSLILLIISFIAIFNDTILSIKEQTRTFGILKAAGLTPSQLRASLACKAMAVAGLGLLIGMPLSIFGIPVVLGTLAEGIGLVQFPFAMNISKTLLIIPGLAIFAFVCAWIPARAVSNLNVRNLICQ